MLSAFLDINLNVQKDMSRKHTIYAYACACTYTYTYIDFKGGNVSENTKKALKFLYA